MNEIIKIGNELYYPYEYSLENDFEQDVVKNAKAIFGIDTLYIDVKKRIGKTIKTVPDGYLIDFTFKDNPKLYIVENELSSHDPFKHIGSQILNFAISYREYGREIKKIIFNYLQGDRDSLVFIQDMLTKSEFRNIDDFLETLIFENEIAAVVVIDKSSSELDNVLSQLTMNTDILEFRAFMHENERVFLFDLHNSEVRGIEEKQSDKEALDTIVVPAREEGFKEEFLKNNCWFEIRISASMQSRLKYIAAYQVAPVSAITHVAEIASIEKYKDTNKYIVYFNGEAEKINPIKLGKAGKGKAPQAPRYTSYDKLMKAKSILDVF
ncbi:MAG: hypothetical protein K9N07_09940 [Candidatus Cloacimonetes bacterium]|nr:hypothetical protein [Candidatus Cloacimonadota bacterium]